MKTLYSGSIRGSGVDTIQLLSFILECHAQDLCLDLWNCTSCPICKKRFEQYWNWICSDCGLLWYHTLVKTDPHPPGLLGKTDHCCAADMKRSQTLPNTPKHSETFPNTPKHFPNTHILSFKETWRSPATSRAVWDCLGCVWGAFTHLKHSPNTPKGLS